MKTSRRDLLKTVLASSFVMLTNATFFNRTWGQSSAAATAPTGPYYLPALGYSYDALEPYIDAETMHLHHDKHHQAYVDKLNTAVAHHPDLATKPIEDLLIGIKSVPEDIQLAVRNQGGGHANHSLFWQTLAKNNGGGPKGILAKTLDEDFGGMDKLKEAFNKAAMGIFGSGWAWVVVNSDKKLQLITTPNQDSPLMNGQMPLFGIDVWEHAYYLKYKNKRLDYVTAFWSVVNWDFVESRYQKLV